MRVLSVPSWKSRVPASKLRVFARRLQFCPMHLPYGLRCPGEAGCTDTASHALLQLISGFCLVHPVMSLREPVGEAAARGVLWDSGDGGEQGAQLLTMA